MDHLIAAPIETYLDSLHRPIDPLLDEIERDGRARGLPLVHPASARLLRTLVIATGARRILEIGTAIGYSAIWMAQAQPAGGLLMSLEKDAERAAVARANVARAGLADRISVVVGDASRYLHKVAGPFDLVFQDSDKHLYDPMLTRSIELLRPGGLLVCDNVLWSGEVVEGFRQPPTRGTTEAAALRAYNARLAAERRLLTTFLAVGDGLSISVRVDGGGSA
jgi:predicted O-methyltransferase YrrM